MKYSHWLILPILYVLVTFPSCSQYESQVTEAFVLEKFHEDFSFYLNAIGELREKNLEQEKKAWLSKDFKSSELPNWITRIQPDVVVLDGNGLYLTFWESGGTSSVVSIVSDESIFKENLLLSQQRGEKLSNGLWLVQVKVTIQVPESERNLKFPLVL